MDAPSLLTSWRFEPLQLLPTLLVAVLYARRVRTLRRRGTPVEPWRPWLFGLGIGLVLLALASPIDAFGEEEFLSFHMLQHIILGDLAPLALVAGLSGPILRPVLALRPISALRFLAHPLVALPLWTIDLYVWHVPFLYQAALHHDSIHALEHLLFFTCGGLMWAPVLEVLPAPEWFGTGWKLAYIVAVRLIETVLGNVFIWSGTVFYPYYRHAHPLWGISALHDQRLASEGELRQQLLERGLDPRAVQRAVRYGRAQEFSRPR